MEIEFFIRPRDVASFRYHDLRTSPYVRKQKHIWYVLGSLCVGYSALPFLQLGLWIGVGALALSIALFLALFKIYEWSLGPYLVKFTTRLLIWLGRPKATLGRHRIRLNEREIVETSHGQEKRSLWFEIQRVVANDEYLFIYDTPKTAYLIPRSAFLSQRSAEEFIEIAQSYHRMATSA